MRLPVSILAAALLFTASCGDTGSTDTESSRTDSSVTAAATPIRLAEVPASPEFADAELTMTGMQATAAGADSVKLAFTFGVKNYELMAQTSSDMSAQCNNSDKGQHIHFILDNRPYVALYEPKHVTTVPKNSEHYLLCFLSRSYHESVKGKGASVLVRFRVDEQGKIQKLEAPTTPMVFYSRPKGDYLGKDTANVLLDFYPVNTTLGADHKVKVDVKNETSGNTASFTLGEWKPQFLQGLGTGSVSVTLTLIDKDGNPLSGPNTTITRTGINLAGSEPMR